jgi:hypothetical protein
MYLIHRVDMGIIHVNTMHFKERKAVHAWGVSNINIVKHF